MRLLERIPPFLLRRGFSVNSLAGHDSLFSGEPLGGSREGTLRVWRIRGILHKELQLKTSWLGRPTGVMVIEEIVISIV